MLTIFCRRASRSASHDAPQAGQINASHLLIIAKSETAKAVALLKVVIDVFLAAARGTLAPQGPTRRRLAQPDRAALRALVRELLYEEAPLLRKIVLPLVRQEQAQLPAGPELLTNEEAAARLGMSVRTFQRRLAQHQELLALRVGRKWPWPLLRERFPLDGG